MSSKMSKDSSTKCFEDVDSDDLSLETSFATDDLILSDDSEIRKVQDKNRRVEQLAQHKKLLRDMQLLRVELSQKDLALKSLRSEHAQHIEELEERLHDITYQKQILQTRLETELQSGQEEAMKRQQTISREMDLVKIKQEHLEAANERLLEKAGHVQQSLRDLSLSPERYYQLKGLREEELSLRDFVAVRVYDMVRPLHIQIDQLKTTGRAQEEELAASADEVMQLKRRLEEEHATKSELRAKLHRVSQDHVENGKQLQNDDSKAVSFDDIKTGREEARRGQSEADRKLNVMEAVHDNLRKERDHLDKQLSMAQQSEALLKQDKEYLSRQVSECTRRAECAEDRLQQVSRQLDDARQTREEVYEKYVTSRDQYKKEYEMKLQEELDKIRAKTEAEMEHLRTSTKEMYERENRSLREARDAALAERDRHQESARDANMKHEQLATQLRQSQSRSDSRICEIESELKVKSLEADRAQMVCDETLSTLKDKALDMELLQKKEEMLRKEYYNMQTAMEKRIVELESQLSERNSKLDTYERLERELDQVIVQAAEATDDTTAEKVLFSYGNVPSTAKRRMEQSVQLAKRVLQLEKENNALQKNIDQEQNTVKQLTNKLAQSTAILEQVQQPHSYLVNSIREREERVGQLQAHIDVLEDQLRRADEEKRRLQHSHQQMSEDLQRLLRQREDIAMLNQAMKGLTARQRAQAQSRVKGQGGGGPGAGPSAAGSCASSASQSCSDVVDTFHRTAKGPPSSQPPSVVHRAQDRFNRHGIRRKPNSR